MDAMEMHSSGTTTRSAERRARGASVVRVSGMAGEQPGAAARAHHWWDAETGILSTRVGERARAVDGARFDGASVHVIGDDGSWLTIDAIGGRVHAVEVAVWPRVRLVRALTPPMAHGDVALCLPAGRATAEVTGAVGAYAERGGGAFHFRVGAEAADAVWRAGRDVLLEATACGRLAGVWLLNVPPSPAARDHDDRPH